MASMALLLCTNPVEARTLWQDVDGMKCSNDTECLAVVPQMYCQVYKSKITPTKTVEYIGECACPDGMVFNYSEIECQRELGIVIIVIVISICIAIILTITVLFFYYF